MSAIWAIKGAKEGSPAALAARKAAAEESSALALLRGSAAAGVLCGLLLLAALLVMKPLTMLLLPLLLVIIDRRRLPLVRNRRISWFRRGRGSAGRGAESRSARGSLLNDEGKLRRGRQGWFAYVRALHKGLRVRSNGDVRVGARPQN